MDYPSRTTQLHVVLCSLLGQACHSPHLHLSSRGFVPSFSYVQGAPAFTSSHIHTHTPSTFKTHPAPGFTYSRHHALVIRSPPFTSFISYRKALFFHLDSFALLTSANHGAPLDLPMNKKPTLYCAYCMSLSTPIKSDVSHVKVPRSPPSAGPPQSMYFDS